MNYYKKLSKKIIDGGSIPGCNMPLGYFFILSQFQNMVIVIVNSDSVSRKRPCLCESGFSYHVADRHNKL